MNKLSPLDDWIRQFYEQVGIEAPDDLNMYRIAAECRIWIHQAPVRSRAIERDGMATIILDNRLQARQQWEEFSHELCHVLRQSGNQLKMTLPFLQYQEWKAERFALQFCIPAFMLHKLDLPDEYQRSVDMICESFNVTRPFARTRLQQHYRDLLQHSYDEQLRAAVAAAEQYRIASGIQYHVAEQSSTMLYCRRRGVLGYIGGESDES